MGGEQRWRDNAAAEPAPALANGDGADEGLSATACQQARLRSRALTQN